MTTISQKNNGNQVVTIPAIDTIHTMHQTGIVAKELTILDMVNSFYGVDSTLVECSQLKTIEGLSFFYGLRIKADLDNTKSALAKEEKKLSSLESMEESVDVLAKITLAKTKISTLQARVIELGVLKSGMDNFRHSMITPLSQEDKDVIAVYQFGNDSSYKSKDLSLDGERLVSLNTSCSVLRSYAKREQASIANIGKTGKNIETVTTVYKNLKIELEGVLSALLPTQSLHANNHDVWLLAKGLTKVNSTLDKNLNLPQETVKVASEDVILRLVCHIANLKLQGRAIALLEKEEN